MRKELLVLAFLFLLVNPCNAVRIIPRSQEYWTCVDYSLDFAKNNPDWGIVTYSDSPTFCVGESGYDSHMVNYQFVDNNTLKIHDGLYKYNYTMYDWKNDGRYYHFWINENPVRTYVYLYDNREELP